MRILELSIDRFGGLTNRHIDFLTGFNLVYGDNEAGKSTILSFIRAMFYGLNSAARRIGDNERKLRMPWEQDRMGGWLIFEHAGRRYRIERTFGSVKRQDQRKLRDDITGELIALPGGAEIGDWLFQVSEAEFLNTVCIGQLATTLVSSEEGTLAKLTNLAATGDELISADTVKNRLRKAMVIFRAEKGNGGQIPALNQHLSTLALERQSTLELEAERSILIRMYRDAVHERDAVAGLLDDGRRIQRACRDRESVLQAGEMTARQNELNALRDQANSLSAGLVLDGHPCTWSDLKEFQVRRDRLSQGQARLDEIRQSHVRKQEALMERLGRRQAYQAISQIDSNSCLNLLAEADQLDQDTFAVSQRLLTVDTLLNQQSQVMAQHRDAGQACDAAQVALATFKEQSKEDLRLAEADAARKRQEWEGCAADLAARRTSVQPGDGVSRRSSPVLLFAGILLILLGIAAGVSISPALFALCPVGLLAIAVYFRQNRQNAAAAGPSSRERGGKSAGDGAQFQLEERERILSRELQGSLERMDALRARLSRQEQALAGQLGSCRQSLQEAADHERMAVSEWAAALTRLHRDQIWQQPRIVALAILPDPVLPAIQGMPLANQGVEAAGSENALLVSNQTCQMAAAMRVLVESLRQRLSATRQQAERLLQDAGCDTAAVFRTRLDELEDLNHGISELEDEIRQHLEAIDQVSDTSARLEHSLRLDLLQLAGETNEPDIDQMLESVRQSLSDLDRLQATIAAKGVAANVPAEDADEARLRLQQAFPQGDAGLAGAIALFARSVATTVGTSENVSLAGFGTLEQQDAAAVIAAGSRQLPALLEIVDKRLGSCSAEAVHLESELTHRFSQLRSLEDIDADLADTDRRLHMAKSAFDAMALARETVDAAFAEMQQSFGPQLNRRGGDILSQLSGGRYADMRVDRSLQISVPDPLTGQLHEADYLSGGTMDQAYLSLRLAVAELIGDAHNRLPLLLDDVLMQYDDQRADAGLAYLRQYAEEQDLQILLFTCHGRLLAQDAALKDVIRLS